MDSWAILAILLLAGIIVLLWVQRRAATVQYLFFCRFPLSIWCGLVAIPPLSLVEPTSHLLANLFVLESWSTILVATGMAVLAAWSITVSPRIVWNTGARRFGVAPPNIPAYLQRVLLFLAAAPALSVIAMILWHSSPDHGLWPTVLDISLGILAAAAVLSFANFLQRWFTNPAAKPLDLFFNITWVPGRLERADPWHAIRAPLVSAIAKRVPRGIGRGYFDYRTHRLLPGLPLGFSLLVVSFLTYLGGAAFAKPFSPNPYIPALGYLLLLLILTNLGLSGLAFFFDRFRVPTLVTFATVSALMYFLTDSDHYFSFATPSPPAPPLVRAPATISAPAPCDLPTKPVSPRDPIVVVAASGGGIQAAAWTARVLTGLQEDPELSIGFTRSIRLISAVSGGSVGSMYFLERFTERCPPSITDLTEILQAAESSSLEATAWGFTYYDVPGMLFPPVSRSRDRGWAIEQAWAERLADRRATLGSWRSSIQAGKRPAVVFNATVVETGKRLLLTPITLRLWEERKVDTSASLYPGQDLPIVTAVRLSATFPYVSPIVRAPELANDPRRRYHLADGGYYENFGVLTALEWLEQLLKGSEEKPRAIIIIQIRAFPPETDKEPKSRRGWLYRAIGPLLTLMHVRTPSQTFRNDRDVDAFRARWSTINMPVESFTFSTDSDGEGPLSWHLSPQEKEALHAAWQHPRSKDLERLRAVWKSVK